MKLVEPVAPGGGRRANAERSREAREKLLQAAIELVAEDGVERFTMADVGAKAGYSRALPAKHFANKAGLVEAVIDRAFRPRAWGEGEGLAPIEAFVTTYLSAENLAEKRCELAILGAALNQPEIAAQVCAANRKRLEKLAARLAAVQGRGEIGDTVHPEAMAIVILGCVRGALSHWLVAPGTVSLETLRSEVWDTLRYSMASSS